MKGKWDNLFWQLPSSETSTQEEVNTTKNLLKLLADSEPDVERQFLELLCDSVQIGRPDTIADVRYEREYSGGAEYAAQETFLVGISRKGNPFSADELSGVEHEGGQADASVLVQTNDSSYQFILEVKTGPDPLTRTQLGKYCNEFDVSPENVGTVQWSKIHRSFKEAESTTTDEITGYLLQQFAEYLDLQNINREVASFRHSGYEKSVAVEPNDGDVRVLFKATEDGSSDTKTLSSEQFKDLFSDLFDTLNLNKGTRHSIFINGETEKLADSIATHTGQEIASTDIGFSEKARYRIVVEEHGGDAGLLKLQEMRQDGKSAEFPNTYHVMLTEWELMQVLSPEEGPGFTDRTTKALFVDLDPEKAV